MIICYFSLLSTVGRNSSVGVATRTDWTVLGSNLGGGEIFHTRVVRSWGPPSLLYRVTYPRIKRPRRGVQRLLQPCTEVKESVELYLYSPSVPSWPVLG
jgi:hypothetical protein